MKNLLYLFFVLPLLFSCGDSESDESETLIVLDNLEVYKSDLGKMNWTEAKKACSELGSGWRLPTLDELKSLCDNQENIEGFTDKKYWSSSTANDGGVEYPYVLRIKSCKEYFKTKPEANVRPVRTNKRRR